MHFDQSYLCTSPVSQLFCFSWLWIRNNISVFCIGVRWGCLAVVLPARTAFPLCAVAELLFALLHPSNTWGKFPHRVYNWNCHIINQSIDSNNDTGFWSLLITGTVFKTKRKCFHWLYIRNLRVGLSPSLLWGWTLYLIIPTFNYLTLISSDQLTHKYLSKRILILRWR